MNDTFEAMTSTTENATAKICKIDTSALDRIVDRVKKATSLSLTANAPNIAAISEVKHRPAGQ